MMANSRLFCALCFLLSVWPVTGRPERRGSCLLLCGDSNGVGCPSGYTCQGNGCGSECFNTSFVQPDGCEPFVCDSRCPLGYARDTRGCQRCECDYSALQALGK